MREVASAASRFLFGANMQVKISFTVGIEEVPRKVDEQLLWCLKELDAVQDSKYYEVTDKNIVQTIDWIERTRKLLLQVDTRMADCYSILTGYNKAQADSIAARDSGVDDGDSGSQS